MTDHWFSLVTRPLLLDFTRPVNLITRLRKELSDPGGRDGSRPLGLVAPLRPLPGRGIRETLLQIPDQKSCKLHGPIP